MEDNKMTVLDALKTAANILENISVPVALRRQISDPICESLDYINACIDATSKPREEPIDLGNMDEVLKEEGKTDETNA